MDTSGTGIAVSATLRADLDDLAKAARILEIHGHGDRIWGHVAMRDPDGRGFWIKRHAISLGEVFNADDFQLTGFDGEPLYGQGRRHSEWPIHGEIFLLRPDLNYTAHTHPFHASIFSAIPEELRQVRGTTPHAPARYEGSSELVTTRERGRELAEAMGDRDAVFMRNHGVVFCGAAVGDMIKRGIELEETCRQTLAANGSGFAWRWPDEEEQARKSYDVKSRRVSDPLWDHYCRILERAEEQGDIRLSRRPVVWPGDQPR